MEKKGDGWIESMMRHWWGNLLLGVVAAGFSYWMYLDNLKLAAGGTSAGIRGRIWYELGGVWGGPAVFALTAVGFAIAAGVQISRGTSRG